MGRHRPPKPTPTYRTARDWRPTWDALIAHYGSQGNVGRIIGHFQSVISKRILANLEPPAEWVRCLHDHCRAGHHEGCPGALALHEMRPDLWDPPRSARKRAA